MTRLHITQSILSAAAALALSLTSATAFAQESSPSSTPPKTEQICQVHPEYSCVEVPTAYGIQSQKEAQSQKKLARKNSKAAAQAQKAQKEEPTNSFNTSAPASATPSGAN